MGGVRQMESGASVRRRSAARGWGETGAAASPTAAHPLVRPAPRSAMFFPLAVLVAVLPGLYALGQSWDLNPPSPWWGLRGLCVLDGWVLDQVPAASGIGVASEARAFRAVALQPPLYAWLEAVGLALSPDRDPLVTVLPSYVAGAALVLLVYLHGRLWRGAGVGLTAAVLTGFNRDLLEQMQQATPVTLALAGAVAALFCYGRHLRAGAEGRILWAVLGGLALGLSLLAVGWFGLVVVPVALLHQAYLGAGLAPSERPPRWWLAWRANPSLVAGALTLAIGLALAVPWFLMMLHHHGAEFLGAMRAPPDPHGPFRLSLAARLVVLAPATLPLTLVATVRTLRLALTADGEERNLVGGTLWLVWLAVAALVPALWPAGPRAELNLFLLLPMNLLAAQAIADLANRRIPIRTLVWLAPVTALSVAWWVSGDLRAAVSDLFHGRISYATALGLHLGLDLLVILYLLTRTLDHWARRRDDRQRRVLAGFLLAVIAVTVASGLRVVRFRHRETRDLLQLREVILRRHQARPFTVLAVVGPDPRDPRPPGPSPGGRLRFILRSALPHLPQRDLTRTEALLDLPEGQRLVILLGDEQRLTYAEQSRLGLEAIHPGLSGILDAFATADTPDQTAKN